MVDIHLHQHQMGKDPWPTQLASEKYLRSSFLEWVWFSGHAGVEEVSGYSKSPFGCVVRKTRSGSCFSLIDLLITWHLNFAAQLFFRSTWLRKIMVIRPAGHHALVRLSGLDLAIPIRLNGTKGKMEDWSLPHSWQRSFVWATHEGWDERTVN